MYAPLGYVEQIENYIYLPNTPEKFSREINDINNDMILSLLNNEEAMKLFIDWYVLEAEKMQHNNGNCTKPCKPFIERVHFSYLNDFAEALTKAGYPLSWRDLKDGDSDLDFMNLVISKGIVEDWKYHKYTYKLAKELGKELINMPLAEQYPTDCFKRLPAKTFYLDCSEFGNEIVDRLEGMFVMINYHGIPEENIVQYNLCIIGLIHGLNGRFIPIYNRAHVLLQGDEDKIPMEIVNAKVTKLLLEDETTVTVKPGMLQLVLNTLMYLQAINKDVKEYDASKETFKKPIDKTTKPKNKFKEVRQYEVGYKISTDLKKNYISKATGTKQGKGHGTPKSAHFRSAHWHRYWVGSGEGKKLIVKWLDGMYIGGKEEAKVAVVHNVK